MSVGKEITIEEAVELAVMAGVEAQELRDKQREEDAAFYDSFYDCDDELDEILELSQECDRIMNELNSVLWVLQEYVEISYDIR